MKQISSNLEHVAAASHTYSVTAATIWAVLSDLEGLANWAPGTDSSVITSQTRSGLGAVRLVNTQNFGELEQVVTNWEEGVSLEYRSPGAGPFEETLTRYDIEPLGSDACQVDVQLAFSLKPGAMEPKKAEAMLAKGLAGILQALELQAGMPD